MYAESQVGIRLELAEHEYNFKPVYHSIEEVDRFESHLRTTYEPFYIEAEKRKPSKPHEFLKDILSDRLQKWETDWMLNERLLVMADAAYFLTRYAWIKTEKNIIQRFCFWIAQKILFDIIAEIEKQGIAIELLILKARQLGLSTIMELLLTHRIEFSYGLNGVIASADSQKSKLMANMMIDCYDLQPWWLKPNYTQLVRSDKGMLVFGQLKSGVSVQHGAQLSGIARGTTPTQYHLSEIASYTDPQAQIDDALLKCVHASPMVFGALESSGEGDKGWFPDTWRYSKEMWPQRRSRFCPLFLPWFCGKDQYPEPTWIKARPVPYEWKPFPDTKEHVKKCELYVASDPVLSKYFPPNWRMPIEQQWFWEVGYEEAKAKSKEGRWLQEMASDDGDALQKSAESVFGYEVIDELRKRTQPFKVFGLTGQAIEDRHEPDPDDIDYDAERILVTYKNRRQQEYHWQLIPLKEGHGWTDENEDILKTMDSTGKLLVFHEPQPGVDYAIGVDTAAGKSQDCTAISVFTIGQKGSPDVQCAEFSSNGISHVEAYAFVTCIAGYYGQYMQRAESVKREPYVSVEQVAAVGDVAQHQMKVSFGYHRFHNFTRLDSRKVDPKRATKQGWFTYSWSRPILIDGFVNLALNSWVEINSPWLIDEMAHFEVHVTKSGKEKLEHEEDEHDDRIFAAAMATIPPHMHHPLLERSRKRFVLSDGTLPELDLRPYGHMKMPLTVEQSRLHSAAERK